MKYLTDKLTSFRKKGRIALAGNPVPHERSMKNVILKFIPVLFLFLASMNTSTAQASDTSGGFLSENLLEVTLTIALVVCVLALMVLIVVLNVLKTFLSKQKEEAAAKAGIPVQAGQESFWVRFYKNFNDAVPIEEERDVLTDHEYDGIRELDNNLPPWWKYMFYLTIVFSVVYMVYYHVMDGPSSAEKYEMEMTAAALQIENYKASLAISLDETNVEVSEDAAVLDQGKEIFVSQCAACHAADGGGGVGPNLADAYWIHGGDIKSLFAVIKNGVPEKGMISWKALLAPEQIQAVSSYILTLQGTTPQAPKEPQGDLVETPVN